MGQIFAEITLKNFIDVSDCGRGIKYESDIRQKTIQALVDTGATNLVIDEALRQELGLDIIGEKAAKMTNDKKVAVKIAGPVEIHWKNRSMICWPWVVPEKSAVLFGVIPLEEMNLAVDPVNQVLVGTHGKNQIGLLVSLFPGR